MEGWIKLHRSILDKPIWLASTPEQKTILITLLLMTNHDEKEWEWEGKQFTCKPGQIITSLDSIQKHAGKSISIQNIRTSILRFEKYEFLTNQSTNRSRLITICNWDTYQEKSEVKKEELTSQLTCIQQAANKQLTTNKNIKNDKNNIITPLPPSSRGRSENRNFDKWVENIEETFREPVSLYMEYKAGRRETYKTEKSFALMVSNLQKLSNNDPVKAKLIVEQSMSNNWAGLFDLKNVKNEQTAGKARKKLY